MQTLLKIILSSSLLLVGSFSQAQIPPTQYSQKIAYITGGVGQEETIAILAEAKQWPLLLELSQLADGRGVWIFGANVKISNTQKQVIFDAQADGPYMLVNLDAGDYFIAATYEGTEQKRVISIKTGSPLKTSIFWK
ncbi:carboxypeptidase regulatory-like domain-containing protein [Polynucleobacter sp.]|jgi:hypothetical protein|uniref:carboxypeptidase regulatory-like domain-containing protein n=1 Tax=Polynucleobacter sp. TaxID=2029855 RepID=UPI0030178540